MKFILFLFLAFNSLPSSGQMKLDSLIWLPEKRIVNIEKNKMDNYTLEVNYPVRKMFFKSDDLIYVFPFYASDPVLVALQKTSESIWIVKQEYLKQIDLGDSTPKSIILNKSDDSLLLTIEFDSAIVNQLFINQYNGIGFDKFNEAYLGYIAISGKYFKENSHKKYQFFEDGTFYKGNTHIKDTYSILEFVPKSEYSLHNTLTVNASLHGSQAANYLFRNSYE